MTATQVQQPRRSDPAPARPRRRSGVVPVLVAVVAVLGMCLLLYPTAASWVAQYNQAQLIESYSEGVRDVEPVERAHEISLAHEYNRELVGGSALLGADARVPTSVPADGPANQYHQMLRADTQGLMARLRIPSIDVDLPVYHGTSDETLMMGVGHLEGTALPVGGVGMHSVLTAHRGLASATMFDRLNELGIGDEFSIEVFGEVLSYQVRATQVVQPEDTETLFPEVGSDLVTLVTCTPLGVNSHRILVTAERVTPTPQVVLDSAGAVPVVPFPWWAVILAGGIVLVAGYLLVTRRPRPSLVE